MRTKLLFLFLFGSLLIQSGQRQERPQDAAAIKANYLAFRTALLEHDHVKAAALVSPNYLNIYSPQRILDEFVFWKGTNMQLTANSRVRFDPKDPSKATLF